ncbi:recombinase family protein [Flavobacterium sp.]|uniref:recombinase family protein n=1 Tax=Flavobacterium sp. TaxID=239 RepID=UPI002616E795|nr:recombinase family protein [Flavobacterium sp.]MDD2986123.1 recombinase family protein [Flavobacterium sp.]
MQKQVLTYVRVSTDDQADRGFSLSHQKAVLELYCQQKGDTILKCFVEDHSAKNFDRPEWKKLLLYVKANKKSIDSILFTRWDRFSRNTEEAYRVIREFKALGIDVNAIEQPLDTSQPDSKVMLGIYLILPEVENDKISIRTKEGMRRAMKEGCYTGAAPIGYLHHRNEQGKSTLKPNPEVAPLIKKAFEQYAIGVYSTEEIRKKYYNKGLKVSKNTLLNILKNPTYTGKIVIQEWKKEDACVVQGLHEAIVDNRTFEKVQKVFLAKQVKPVLEHKEIDEILPLRGFLKCPACSRTLTGSGSMGGGVTRHYYYHCNPPCKVRYKAEEVHRVLEKLLREFVINQDSKEVYKKILQTTFKTQAGDRESELKSLKREINKLSVRLDSIEEKFFDNEIDIKVYNTMKRKTESQIAHLKAQVETINALEKDFENHLKRGISFLQTIDSVFTNAPASIKKKILGALFPDKLIFEKTYFKTSELDEFIGYILLNTKKLKYVKVDGKDFDFKKERQMSNIAK